MHVVVAGGHGQIAMLLHPLLSKRGHTVTGLIRAPEQAADLRQVGAEPVVCDLERADDLSSAVGMADAVLFAAGAGPGSGAERKFTVDRDGAIRLLEAAQTGGVRRYVMISAMKVEQPRGSEVFRAYLRAKAEADAALRESGLDYTIVRPGRLTNERARGLVTAGPDLPRREIPRADVAAVLAYVLDEEAAVNRQFDVTTGDQTIPEAIDAVAA